jgi:hypothetical protein
LASWSKLATDDAAEGYKNRVFDERTKRVIPGEVETVRTAPLVQSAQQFSAGFIKFFFDSVDGYGDISGSFNPSGGPAGDVLVSVSSPSGRYSQTTRTNSMGYYRFTSLPVGIYEVSIYFNHGLKNGGLEPYWAWENISNYVRVRKGRVTSDIDYSFWAD